METFQRSSKELKKREGNIKSVPVCTKKLILGRDETV